MPGDSMLEATPLVVDGVMYTTQPGVVVALDARTGRQIWRYTRPQKVEEPERDQSVQSRRRRCSATACSSARSTPRCVALDARTGLPLWETQVADTMLGYSITSAPLVVKDKVIVGITGGEFGARGFLDAYDAATGKRLWRWYTVPGPGEFGNDTWTGDSWKQGGSPMWLTGSYDPELNLVYWTVGNPGPQIDRSVRGDLDNLFSDSVVAIDPDTGQRKWHYQFTPNDGHDWDSCQDVILVDRDVARPDAQAAAARRSQRALLRARSHERRVPLGHAVRLRRTGTAASTRTAGRIIVPGSNSSREGSFFVYPTLGGAHELPGAVVQPAHRLVVPRSTPKAASGTSARRRPFEAGQQYIGRATTADRGGRSEAGRAGADRPGIKALDPETGKTMWDFKIFQGSLTNGVLATGGNVVFARDARRQPRRARRADRQAPVALPDRRQHGRLADELRGRRPAIRRHRRRQHGLRFALPE